MFYLHGYNIQFELKLILEAVELYNCKRGFLILST